MKTKLAFGLATTALAMGWASLAFAGSVTAPPPVGAPAPLLGAGLPGLAILVAAGGGYLAMRLRRRGRD